MSSWNVTNHGLLVALVVLCIQCVLCTTGVFFVSGILIFFMSCVFSVCCVLCELFCIIKVFGVSVSDLCVEHVLHIHCF